METTIVQPGSTPSIYSTGDHGRHNHHDDHGRRFDAVESRADFRSLTNEVERFGTQNLASAARTNEIVQAGACRTDSLVQAGFGDTSDWLFDRRPRQPATRASSRERRIG